MSDDTHRLSPHEPSLSDAPTGQMRTPAPLIVEAAGRTDKGRVRPGNEDAFGFEPPTSSQARAHGTLLIVSDGMGGHAAGEVASRIAVETIQQTYYRERGGSTADSIRNAIVAANSAIFSNAEQDAKYSGMGCTVVVMVVQGSRLTVGHVGDSRGYLIRGGQARQLTRDHSWVAMQVEEGILTPEQAEHHPNRSVLMRALGRQPSVEVEIGQHQLQPGDVLLLCSDGLTGVVNDAEIGDYASRYAPATVADQLVNLANQRGAPDNVTVLAAEITEAASAASGANSAATTVVAPAADVPTPRLTPPPDTATTTPSSRRARSKRTPSAGTPIVLSRESVPPGGPTGKRRRGRWIAGSVAALGLAAGLVLLTTLGPREAGTVDAPRAADAPATSRPAAPAGVGQAAPTVTVPPPVATGLPNLTPAAPAVAAAPPPPATPAPAPPTATPGLATAIGPAATAVSAIAGDPSTAPNIPGVVAGILATPTQPAGSTSAATAPTSTPTATPTPTENSADAPPVDTNAPQAGADAPADAPVDEDAVNPATTDPSEPDADSGDAAAGPGDSAAAEAGAPPAEAQSPSEPPAEQPAPPVTGGQAPRFSPGSGISIPDSLPFRPSRKPSDD